MKRKYFILFPLLFVLFVLLAGFVVMWLWNAILPGLIAGVGYLTFPKALGLLVLCRILFGGMGGGFKGRRQKGCGGRGGGPAAWKSKWAELSEEERDTLRKRFGHSD